MWYYQLKGFMNFVKLSTFYVLITWNLKNFISYVIQRASCKILKQDKAYVGFKGINVRFWKIWVYKNLYTIRFDMILQF